MSPAFRGRVDRERHISGNCPPCLLTKSASPTAKRDDSMKSGLNRHESVARRAQQAGRQRTHASSRAAGSHGTRFPRRPGLAAALLSAVALAACGGGDSDETASIAVLQEPSPAAAVAPGVTVFRWDPGRADMFCLEAKSSQGETLTSVCTKSTATSLWMPGGGEPVFINLQSRLDSGWAPAMLYRVSGGAPRTGASSVALVQPTHSTLVGRAQTVVVGSGAETVCVSVERPIGTVLEGACSAARTFALNRLPADGGDVWIFVQSESWGIWGTPRLYQMRTLP